MHRIEIPYINKVVEIPSDIHEMNENQFIDFVGLVLQYSSGTITLKQFKISLIISLLDIRLNLRYALMSPEQREELLAEVYRLAELSESFFEQVEQKGETIKTFKLTFTRNFIPVVCGIYHGPADALQDVTFCEYRHAHRYYAAYLKSHSEDDLNHMIAVLYRPLKRFLFFKRLSPSFNGQYRVPFTSEHNPILLAKRAREIGNLPFALRYGIFLFFSGCERFLVNGQVTVDGKTIDLSVIYSQGDSSPDYADIGLTGILFSLAETRVFGSIGQTDDQNLYDILLRLYQLVMQSKAMDQKLAAYDSR